MFATILHFILQTGLPFHERVLPSPIFEMSTPTESQSPVSWQRFVTRPGKPLALLQFDSKEGR
jgi:hypothetical protein